MDNIDTSNTTQQKYIKVLIIIAAVVVVIGLVWYVNNNTSEKFSNEEVKLKPEIQKIRRINQNMELREIQENELVDDVDENIRRQANASHQLHMAEVEKEEQRLSQSVRSYNMTEQEPEEPVYLPLAANVPLSHPSSVKPYEAQENTLVQFAKDTQKIVDKYRPNDIYKQVPNNNGKFYNLTADDRTIALMNLVDSNKGNYDVACNLSNTLSDADKAMVSDYKNKYYNMYAHQISCANSTGKLTGCGKKCYANGMSPNKCTTQACDNSMDEMNNSADFVSLNQLILEKNNSRPCSTCTQRPMLSRAVGVQNVLDQVTNYDNVSAGFMDSQLVAQQPSGTNGTSGMRESFNNLSNELKSKDKELAKKKKVSFANVNNFANFNNYVNQNGVLETSVDKLAEIRTDVTNSATCGLKQYGQTISQVYDNLMDNPYMEYKKSCDVGKITGILEDKVNDYQGNGNFGGNYSGDFAHV